MSKPLVLCLCVLLPFVLSYDWKIGGLSYGNWGSNYTAGDDPFNIAQFMHLAILYVNNYTDMLTPYNITMKMEFYDVHGSTTQGVIKAFHLAETFKVRGVAGGVFSTEVIAEAQVLQYFEVPQTSGIASSTLLSDKTLYPYFFRVGPEDTYETLSVLVTLKQIGFTQAVLVYSTDDYGISCRTAFLAKASSYGVKAVAIPIATDVTTEGEYNTILQLIKDTNINVIVMYTQAKQGNSLIIQANATGMIGEKYSYFLSSTLANQFITHSPGNADPSLLDGMIGIAFASGSGVVYEDVKSVWDSLDPKLWFGAGGTADPGFPAWYSFDSVYVFALGLRNLLEKGYTVETITGKMYKDELFKLHELGTTNDIIFNENGDRLAYFDIYNWKNKGTTPTRVGLIDPAANYTSKEQITFYGGSTVVPNNVNFVCSSCIHGQCMINVGCMCDDGWKGSSCDVKEADVKKTLAWLIPVIIVFIIILLGGVYYWYHKKRRAFVKDVSERQRSQIERQDLIFKERIGRGASGEVTKAIYRGTDVAVKRIIASHASKSAIEEFELEVAIMCGLRHPNIILFMGSCYDPVGGEMLLVMELMTRGSLNDVLNNPKIPLAYDMLLHLATQAAQGMNFLHQSNPPIIHHDLKSHNILLDDKWNARISDFGITRFKENNKSQKETKTLGTIYWSAPELLAGDAISEKIDCYAFGIVLWEIFHRQNPYSGRDPMSVAIDVLHKDYRPSISYSVAPEIRSLITSCWAPKANDRPSFQQIMTTLRGLTALAPVQSYETSSAVRVDAPSGLVYLVSTDIIGAYQLWDVVPKAMESSVKLHAQVLRTNMENYKGYEVSYNEHSFVIAFSTIEDATNFCIATQISLLNVSWPTEILAHPAGKLEIKNGVCIWKGLRVRMSVVSGVPNCAIDPSSGRMNYFGPVVDKAGKLLSLQYNTVLLSDSFADEFNKKFSTMKLIQTATMSRIGDILVTARDRTENIYQLVIDALSQRNSGKPDEAATPLPHMVISVHEYEETVGEVLTPKQDTITKPIDWIAKNDDITSRSPIGKGGIGDYFRASWKGKEVALKVLVNQKLKEDDMLRLVCDSSMMRKMNHPNVLPFYAICVEPNHITILSEYESLGSLKAVLADNTIQLSFNKKAKMMLELAQGMQYISTHPDPTMRMHDNLKSNNVLVSKNWEVKVADYGHSNIRELARTLTSVGNIAWTAPEILQGEKATVKISQYSFGIIMWETYTRQVPYVDEHPIKTVSKILNGYRPPFPVDCPTVYSSLMQKCLANTPEERPDWEEIIQTLATIN